jgi:phosphatidylglycerophosphate synthase
MNAPARLRPFHLIQEDSSITLLGLPVVERNRRVAARAGGVTADGDALPTLTVPPGVALTQAFFAALPPAAGTLAIHSDATPLPIVWSAPAADSARPPTAWLAPAGVVLDVSTPAARHASSWALLRASGKPTDGWLSRHVHRRISRIFSYAFLQLGLTANVATALTFLLGAAGAWLIAQTSHWTMMAGALLYWGSSIADGIDGEMARLTLSESAFGEQLDTGVDQATHLLALTGAGVGWWRQGIEAEGWALAALVMVGVPGILLWAMALVRRAKRTDAFFVVTKPIELAVIRAARVTGALPLRIAAAVFILFRREAFSCSAFVVSLVTGLRVVYPALVAASLAVVAATFLFYRGPLNEALEHVTS